MDKLNCTGRRVLAACALAASVLFASGLATMGFATSALAATKVGATAYARGAAVAEREGQVRLLGNGTPIFEGDVLTLGKRSLAIVHFDDGTKVTLRPDTVFTVEGYGQEAGRESLFMRLFKGGLRAVTGLIAQRRPESFRLATPVATIGVRGTDFSARLCTDDCAREASALAQRGETPESRPAMVVGRAAFVRGTVRVVGATGRERPLAVGGPLHEGDTVETEANGQVVLAFRDRSRISLQPSTRFQIDRHTYDAERPENSSALLRLLRGGLRAVSGLIARARPDSFKLATPVATIGVRGTSFDVLCSGDCGAGGSASIGTDGATRLGWRTDPRPEPSMIRTQAGPTPNGLFVALRGEGQLFFLLGDGNEVRVPTNGIGFLGPGMAVPQFGVTLPPALLRELPPPPETIEVDPNLLAATQEEPRPALWTSINREGDHVVVQREGTNEQLDVAFGETVVADDQAITRTTMQDWQILDRLNINPTLELTDPRLLRDAGNVADELSCVAQ